MDEVLRKSRTEMWRKLTTVPHRAIGPLVRTYREAIKDDPDFAARAMVYLYRTSKIRDQADAATAAMLLASSETGRAYSDYRDAGRVMLVGNDVYSVDQDGNWGLPPYRTLRVLRFLHSPWVVTVGGNLDSEIERFHTEKAAVANLPRIARRELRKRSKDWRPPKDATDETLVQQANLVVVKDKDHPRASWALRRTTADWLEAMENNPSWWLGVEFLNRSNLRTAYVRKEWTPKRWRPKEWVRAAVFDGEYPEGSKRDVLRQISESNDPDEQLRLVRENKISYRILQSVLPDTPASKVVLVEAMTPTEALNSRSWLEESGILSIPAVKEVYLEKVRRADTSAAAIRTRVSAKGADEEVQKAVDDAANRAVKKGQLIEGDIAVLIDRSGSMSAALYAAAPIASYLAAHASDDASVRLVYFDSSARVFDVTGYSRSDIEEITSRIRPGGFTSMLSGWQALDRIDFIPNKAIFVTDGGENSGVLSDHLRQQGWEGQLSIVWVSDARRSDSAFQDRLERAGYTVDVIDARDSPDFELVAEQAGELLGGPAAMTIADRINDTEIPRINRNGKVL